MSTLIYNGISLDILKTHEVGYHPVLDDGGAYLYTRVAISVSGLINPKATSYVAQDGAAIQFDDSDPTVSLNAIKLALSQPRAPLLYDSGGSPDAPLVVSPDVGFPCDANNGPIPGPVRVTRVDGTKTYHVNFSVETWVVKCPGDITPTALISNRYAQTHSVDALHYTTISTVGQAFFRTDLLEKAKETADHYRHLLLPPVPAGFRRQGITITITPTRNALTYHVADQERPFDLDNDKGVVDCRADYQVSSVAMKDGGMVGPMTLHQVNVTALGNKNSSNWELTKFCITLANARLPIGDPAKGFTRQVAIRQGLTERSVTLTVVMLLNPKKNAKIGVLDADILQVDQVFPDKQGRNPNMPNRKGTAGTYANELLVSAWKDACAKPTPTTEGTYNPGDPTAYTSPGSPTITVTTADYLPNLPTKYSDSTCLRPYTDYAISIDHDTTTSTMQVPLASSAADPADSGDEVPDAPDCAFLTLARPMHRRVYRWTAERVGQMPDLPSPATTDKNMVAIDTTRVRTEAPTLLPDGESLAYRVSGTYIYGLKKAPDKAKGLPMGSMPWIAGNFADNAIQDASFVNGIIDEKPADAPPPADPVA